jgi:hypothetical protein
MEDLINIVLTQISKILDFNGVLVENRTTTATISAIPVGFSTLRELVLVHDLEKNATD